MTGPKVRLDRDGAVAHLVLNRPEKLNALDDESVTLIGEHAATVAADPSVRALVVRGEGRAFCAGADLGAVGDELSAPERFDAFLDRWHAAYDALDRCPVPTVAAVHGAALAGGFELTHVCDLVVLAADARFGDGHAAYGLYPAGGGTHRLVHLVGERRAAWLLMSGDPLPPSDALAWRLVNEVVPAGRVLPRAVELAERLASRSPALNAALKRSLRAGRGLPVPDALREERPHAVAHQNSPDARAGVEAFRSRTAPRFADRDPQEGKA